MKKYFRMVMFCAVLFLVVFKYQSIDGEAATVIWDKTVDVKVTEGNNIYYAYLSEDKKYSWIYQVEQVKKKDFEVLRFPEVINGAVVVKIGGRCEPQNDIYRNIWGSFVEPYHNLDYYEDMPKGIKYLRIPDTVTQITGGAFCGFRDLEAVKLPDGMKKLSYGIFYNCRNLKEVELPKKLKNIDYTAFKRCGKLKKFKISSGAVRYSTKKGMLLSKDGKTFCRTATGKKYVRIPEGVEIIATAAFTNSRAKKIWIPESVTSIQDASLCGRKIEDIFVSANNPYYAKSGECIYSKRSERLVAAICRNGTVTLPKQVKYLTENVSCAGKWVKKLIVPKTVEKFKKNCFDGLNKMVGGLEVYFKSKTPPKAAKSSFSHFSVYYVPMESIGTYKKWCYDILGVTEDDNIMVDFKEY